MNKTALKNFAVWARNKLIADITYKAGLMGITEDGIKAALPQSTEDAQFYDIGTKEPYLVGGEAMKQRRRLAELINEKAVSSDYKTAFHSVIEEVAYTWFNRLIAVRFMEVNDYLPSHIRVLSSESADKLEPDLVTTPFDADLDLTETERTEIIRLKNENQVDVLFRMLFIKQCNALNALLPKLFEKTADYSELLLNVSVTDQDGVVYHLVHDIEEDDFNIEKGGQVEIIGWMYQYYNDDRKNEVININKGTVKKEDVPAATQLFTTDWVVRYIVDNSLGRYWVERNPASSLKNNLTYFVTPKNSDMLFFDGKISPTELKVLDPCMGSGHFLVYSFEVLMQIYSECGYSEREASLSILENNLYGLDIDDRAFQLAYFAVMMKARQYNRRILNGNNTCHLYSIQESNGINRNQLKYFGAGINNVEKNDALDQMNCLLDTFIDAKEYGSILKVKNYDWALLQCFAAKPSEDGQISLETIGLNFTQVQLQTLIEIGQVMTQKFDIVVTNPPYLNKMDSKLKKFVIDNYKDYSGDLFSVFIYRNFDYCKSGGYSGFMTPYVWMFIQTYEKLRSFIIEKKSIVTLVQMEYSAFEEATVPICSVVFRNDISVSNGLYIKLSGFKGGMEVQKSKVLKALESHNCCYFFEKQQQDFIKIPGSPIAYWLSIQLVENYNQKKLCDIGSVKSGMQTGNNDLFLRLWFEVSSNKCGLNLSCAGDCDRFGYKWVPQSKGGEYKKWYGNYSYVVNFENCCHAISVYQGTVRIRDINQYFKRGITWSHTTSGNFGARILPNGFTFNVESPTYFQSATDYEYILGFLNSNIAQQYLSALNSTLHYLSSNIISLPILINTMHRQECIDLVKNNISLAKRDWDSFETSWGFECHPLVQLCHGVDAEDGHEIAYVEDAYIEWQFDCEQRFKELKSNEEELNRIFIDIYGLQDELTPEVEDKDVTVSRIYDNKEEIPESMKRNNYVLTKCDVIKSFLSYAIGCIFGRYSLDKPGLAYAGGEWDDSKYSSFMPDKDNILPITDEAYFEDDIVGRFVEFVKAVYGEETLEENLDFIAKALGNKGNTSREVIRNYFLNDFFRDHCATYSVTGSGKRPIYWLFDSGKQNGFKALIYMHRYNENTVGNLRIDYLHRMERVYESEIVRMQDTIDNSANAREVTAAAKRKEKLQKQIKECKEYDEKIAHLALARIAIDLDDGVKVNYEKIQTDTDGKFYQVLAKI